MTTSDQPSFARMCRTFPARTALFTLGPLAVGTAQLLNAVVHEATLWPVVAITAVMVVFSVLVTSYHLAVYRRHRLSATADSVRPGSR